jgi:signal transduction histidine kinase
LAILRSTLQNLEEDAGNPEEVRRASVFLRDEIDRLARVTGSILGFARPLTPRPSSVRVAELLERVRALPPLEVREKNLRLELRDASDGARVDVDADLLSQALLGLVTNAAQAAPTQGVVTVEAVEERGAIVLAVLDDGPGVPAAERERVFEPFYSTRKEGHGLGLAIVRQIAGALGARVEVGDARGGGARFSIVLPAR